MREDSFSIFGQHLNPTGKSGPGSTCISPVWLERCKLSLSLSLSQAWRAGSIQFYSILFYSILFYSILFYSILFYSILFYSILFYSILFYSILFYSILFYSILFYSSVYPVLTYII